MLATAITYLCAAGAGAETRGAPEAAAWQELARMTRSEAEVRSPAVACAEAEASS
jgi:hypothetical protein